MLEHGRIPHTDAEGAAITKLIAKHPAEPVSLTRRDPGETGPLLVHVGDDTYEVSGAGRSRKLKRSV
jgi:hypothetical protein